MQNFFEQAMKSGIIQFILFWGFYAFLGYLVVNLSL